MSLRRSIALLIVMASLTQAPIWSYEGEPTDAELAGWWNVLSRSERLEQLRLLDRVEHEMPVASFPEYDVFVTETEIIMRPRSAAVISVGHLEWEFTLPEQRTIYEPVKEQIAGGFMWALIVAAFVGGLLIGGAQ